MDSMMRQGKIMSPSLLPPLPRSEILETFFSVREDHQARGLAGRGGSERAPCAACDVPTASPISTFPPRLIPFEATRRCKRILFARDATVLFESFPTAFPPRRLFVSFLVDVTAPTGFRGFFDFFLCRLFSDQESDAPGFRPSEGPGTGIYLFFGSVDPWAWFIC